MVTSPGALSLPGSSRTVPDTPSSESPSLHDLMMQENSYWKVERVLAERAAKNGTQHGPTLAPALERVDGEDVKNGKITVPGVPAACANEFDPSLAEVEVQPISSEPPEGPPLGDRPDMNSEVGANTPAVDAAPAPDVAAKVAEAAMEPVQEADNLSAPTPPVAETAAPVAAKVEASPSIEESLDRMMEKEAPGPTVKAEEAKKLHNAAADPPRYDGVAQPVLESVEAELEEPPPLTTRQQQWESKPKTRRGRGRGRGDGRGGRGRGRKKVAADDPQTVFDSDEAEDIPSEQEGSVKKDSKAKAKAKPKAKAAPKPRAVRAR